MLEYDLVKLDCLKLCGRRKCLTDKRNLTIDNIAEVVGKADSVHSQNVTEIKYLYNVYRGIQDIRDKTKIVREEINNKVAVNIANEIVTFKSAYLLSSEIQYVSARDGLTDKLNTLNDFMLAEDKESKDKETADWIHICGVAPRFVWPCEEDDGSPAHIYTLSPIEAYVIYYSGLGGKLPLAGVLIQKDEDGEEFRRVYTADFQCVIKNGKVVGDATPNVIGLVPIVEYENNMARIGAFETVLTVLNAINTLESNRVDNIQDFVNAFDVFQNCEVEEKQYQGLASGGKAVMIKDTVQGMEAKVYRITSEMNQAGVQSAIDDLNDNWITICGLPNRNGGNSTSDTGQGVIYRDGWQDAESRAKDTEKLWIPADRRLLKIFLKICRDKNALDLDVKDVRIQFTRKNLSNMQSKVQVLCEMLNSSKIHPKYAFECCGIFSDVERAYSESMKWYEEQAAKAAEQTEEQTEQTTESEDGEQ